MQGHLVVRGHLVAQGHLVVRGHLVAQGQFGNGIDSHFVFASLFWHFILVFFHPKFDGS